MGTSRKVARSLGAAGLVALGAVLLGLGASPALGGKPGGATPPVDTGTVYYGVAVIGNPTPDLWSMAPDGSGVTDIQSYGRPSDDLHFSPTANQNVRWFLKLMTPTGGTKRELFAVTDAGDEVQLTSSVLVEPSSLYGQGVQWATAGGVTDGKVSCLAVQYTDTGAVSAAGVFTLAVDWVTIGAGGTYSPGIPTFFTALATILDSDRLRINAGYDWSPDGTAVVYQDQGSSDDTLYVATPDGRASVGQKGYGPSWSSQGVIAFSDPQYAIKKVNPDGSGLATIVAGVDYPRYGLRQQGLPVWSPNGTYLVYTYREENYSKGTRKWEIYRVTASGGGKTLLMGSATAITDCAWVD